MQKALSLGRVIGLSAFMLFLFRLKNLIYVEKIDIKHDFSHSKQGYFSIFCYLCTVIKVNEIKLLILMYKG